MQIVIAIIIFFLFNPFINPNSSRVINSNTVSNLGNKSSIKITNKLRFFFRLYIFYTYITGPFVDYV